MRIGLAACALMLVLAGPAPGAEKVWDLFQSSEEARLFYGIPESEAVTIVFVCEAEATHIDIVTTVLPLRPRKGQPVRTTLGNGAVTAAYDGKIGSDSPDEGYYVEATAAREPKVVDVLRSGTSLTISIPGKRTRVPLRGVAGPLAKFEAVCFRSPRQTWLRARSARAATGSASERAPTL